VSITIQRLLFYRAVARNRSFSNAAKELYTSQPYVSNQIRKLEEHFRVPLFVRTYPQITLTEAGEALYERVDQLLNDVDALEEVVQQFQGLQRGTIQLGATASAGNHVVPELIASFNRAHPDIVIQVRVGNTGEVMEWLDLDDVEIGISPRTPESTQLSAEPFYREALIVIAPAAMELPEPLTIADFATLPKIAREDGSLTLERMQEVLADHPGGMDFVAQFGGTTAVNEAVAAGLGVSLVPERSAKAWLDAGSVRSHTLAGTDLYHGFYLLYSKQHYITPAARALVEHLRRNRTVAGGSEFHPQ
jgi:LysR family transcriptional regulator, low CO2-responsive transcriptional regulator